jgi:ferrous iron transport protein B
MTDAGCHTDAAPELPASRTAGKARLSVAIAGNPNTGKTTLLNHLVGANFSVGNWPGVTVEKKQGSVVFNDVVVDFVDLPGIYTLEPVSDDERIAVDYLKTETPDVILNVIETPNIERNLVLSMELAEMGIPMVMALNMADEAVRGGLAVNCATVERLTGIRALPTVGRTGQGVKALLPALIDAQAQRRFPRNMPYGDALEARLRAFDDVATCKHDALQRLTADPNAVRAIEGLSGQDLAQVVRDGRAGAAEGLYRAVAKRQPKKGREFTAALDAVFLHPILGLAAYLVIMYLFFKIAFDVSAPIMAWLDGFINGFVGPLASQILLAIQAPSLLAAFVGEAVIGGVGFVITFLPLIVIMFFLLTLMGMTGYMARLPFLLDRFMRRFGLNGKAVIPLLLGLGCNVPAIMATRTMESRRDKLLVTMMIPFISCPARLVIFSFFAALFFPDPALIIMGLYIGGIVVAVLTSMLLKNTLYRREATSMLIELPPYRMPRMRTIGVIVWSHAREFLRRAGTTIFAVSIVVWLMVHIPFGTQPENSVVARVGKAITPIFAPLGIDDWRVTTSLIPAFLARETALSFMATVYSVEDERPTATFNAGEALAEQGAGLVKAVGQSAASLVTLGISTLQSEDTGQSALRGAIAGSMGPAAALSFMILMLLYNSCLAVASVMAKEIGRKESLAFLVYSFALGWGVAFVVYRIGVMISATS